jgi:hypothetical protein
MDGSALADPFDNPIASAKRLAASFISSAVPARLGAGAGGFLVVALTLEPTAVEVMSPGWFGRRSRKRGTASDIEEPSREEQAIELRPREGGQREIELIEALRERFEVQLLDKEGPVYRVTVDDSRFSHQAVVRLVYLLDELDPSWEETFAWPEAMP